MDTEKKVSSTLHDSDRMLGSHGLPHLRAYRARVFKVQQAGKQTARKGSVLWEEMLTLLVFTLEKVKGISQWRHSNQNARPFICKGQAADCSPHPDGMWAPGLGMGFRAGLDLNLSLALCPLSCAGGLVTAQAERSLQEKILP